MCTIQSIKACEIFNSRGNPTVEVPNGAAGHYLLGLISQDIYFKGPAEEGNAIFSESASLYVQKTYSGHGLVSQSMLSSTENKNSVLV